MTKSDRVISRIREISDKYDQVESRIRGYHCMTKSDHVGSRIRGYQ